MRAAILGGELAPGQDISQVQLAKGLGVSRTPLREALRMLEREGLVETKPSGRQRVAGFSLPDLEELYALRLPIEVSAIRLTIPRLTPEDIASMEGDMAQMAHFAADEDHARWEVPHRSFHRRLTSGAGPRTAALLDELSDHAERYRRLYTTRAPHGWEDAHAEHRAILDAAAAGDVEAAGRRLADHLAHTALALFTLIPEEHEPERLREVLASLTGAPDPDAVRG